MQYEIEDIESKAREKIKENVKFLDFIKEYDIEEDSDEIDHLFRIISDRVSSEIDCTDCGRCCINHTAIFYDND